MYLNVKKGSPKKDGTYYYIQDYHDGLVIVTMDYTVEYGWNTSTYAHEYPIQPNEYYIGYAPIEKEMLYFPKYSEAVEDMLDEIIDIRRNDPLNNGEYKYDSDEEERKWEYFERLEELLTELKDNYKTCEEEKWLM